MLIFILIATAPFSASKKQLAGFISSLHGHVAPLLRHMVGSVGMHSESILQLVRVYLACFRVFSESTRNTFHLFTESNNDGMKKIQT